MRVISVHTREFQCSPQRVGELIDSLASKNDLLWPLEHWPAMRFDRPLGVGAIGGHGPIRYTVEHYEAGREVRFRFTAPAGFDGYHGLNLEQSNNANQLRLRHILEMNARGSGAVGWVFVYRWLHDALVENALDRAEQHVTGKPVWTAWSGWVHVLRWVLQSVRRAKIGSPKRPHN